MGQAPVVAVLAGDGIGPEVTMAATRILSAVRPDIEYIRAPVGGAALASHDDPLPRQTLEICEQADAILFGAVGCRRYDDLEPERRPEQALLTLRRRLGLFANIRPAFSLPFTRFCSPLREALCENVDLVIVCELLGGLYYGRKQAFRSEHGSHASDTLAYSESEIERTARIAFDLASQRRRYVVSVDKHNVLATSRLWREVVSRVAAGYPDVLLAHMLVDTAAMKLVQKPDEFDVIVTENTFGDILSDEAAGIVGTIGVLPSASIGETTNRFGHPRGLFEPISGSAPDIAGLGTANPVAAILSGALLLRYSLDDSQGADRITAAVESAYAQGWCTPDIEAPHYKQLTTGDFTSIVLAALPQSDMLLPS